MKKIDWSRLLEFLYIIPFGILTTAFVHCSIVIDDPMMFNFACVIVALFLGCAWITYHLSRITVKLEGLK